jgi:2-haloalkanoic acid dehalogenase type II
MVEAVTFDAYGTLLRNEGLRLIGQRIVADHELSASVDDVYQAWIEGYYAATPVTPFSSLRVIQRQLFGDILRRLGVDADPAPYVDLFFELTTKVELYPEVPAMFEALRGVRTVILSNADHEHVAAWAFTLPVEFVLISEAVGAYKPDRRMFEAAVARLGLEPGQVLHVGDSDVDDVQGAKAAGLRVAWVNRQNRPRRPGVPEPDFEIADLTPLPGLLARLAC